MNTFFSKLKEYRDCAENIFRIYGLEYKNISFFAIEYKDIFSANYMIGMVHLLKSNVLLCVKQPVMPAISTTLKFYIQMQVMFNLLKTSVSIKFLPELQHSYHKMGFFIYP